MRKCFFLDPGLAKGLSQYSLYILLAFFGKTLAEKIHEHLLVRCLNRPFPLFFNYAGFMPK